jgi:hypothetical protein
MKSPFFFYISGGVNKETTANDSVFSLHFKLFSGLSMPMPPGWANVYIIHSVSHKIPSRTTWGSVTPSNYGPTPGYMGETVSRTNTIDLLYSYLAGMNGIACTMHNVLCTSVTIEVRFTASRSSGSHRDWPHSPGGIRRVWR